MRLHSRLRRLRSPLATLVLGLSATAVMAQNAAQLPPARPGGSFPAAVYNNLNVEAGGPEKIDLATVLGKKPIVLVYWIATNPRAERIFQEVQSLVDEAGADRVALYGVAIPRPHIPAEKIQERARALDIKVPVLDDEGFQLGIRLRVANVPNVTIIDKQGRMQLTNGASLSQVLGYKVDLGTAIRKTAETGNLMTYGYLDRYYPVKELEGRPCPDFRAPLLKTSVEQRYHSLLDDQKVNILIFWSVDCPHCRKSLPEISEWAKQHGDRVKVITAANVNSEAAKAKTEEFCAVNDFQFPTLIDRDAKVGDLYQVTSTPTILIIRPDGVVDSAITSAFADFGKAMDEKIGRLLKSSG